MSESKEENSKSKPQEEHGFAMDFDVGLESPWPLDHISSVSNPMSSFLLSTISEQPFSPVWAFSDVEDDRNIRIAASGISSLIVTYPYFVIVCFCLFQFGCWIGFWSFLQILGLAWCQVYCNWIAASTCFNWLWNWRGFCNYVIQYFLFGVSLSIS